MSKNKTDVFTDYPIIELGDKSGEQAPVRPCKLLAYDGDKYALVLVEGVTVSFKAGYLYPKPHRCGEGPAVSRRLLASVDQRWPL